MRMLRCLCVAMLLVSVGGPAQAADEDPRIDPATQELIEQGIILRRSGKDEAALSVFLDAERRAPSSVRVLLHVTAAAQATGRWLMAHDYLQKAGGYRNDPYYLRYRASIKAVEDTVAQHIGQFRVIGTPDGAEVLLNGQLVGTLPMNAAKVVEVGAYVLEVRKPGYYPLSRPINIAVGAGLAQEAVELKEQDTSSILPVAARAGQSGIIGTGAWTEPQPRTGLRAGWITWTLAGTGAALAVTSGVMFALREGEASHWNDDARCLDSVDVTRTREQICSGVREDAKTAERAGIVTGVLALGFGGASLAHWLWASDRPNNKQVGGVRATCDAGLGSILCHGSF